MNTSQISAKNWTEHEVNSQIAPKIAQTGTTRWPCPATPVPWTTPPTIPPRGEPPASRHQPEHSAATPRSVERMARRKTKTEWGESTLRRGISGADFENRRPRPPLLSPLPLTGGPPTSGCGQNRPRPRCATNPDQVAPGGSGRDRWRDRTATSRPPDSVSWWPATI